MLRYLTLKLVNLSFPTQTDTQTDTHLSDCSSSLASAEIEILLRMEYQPIFVRSGKIGWARLTDKNSHVWGKVVGV